MRRATHIGTSGNIYNFRDLGPNIWRISGIRKKKMAESSPPPKNEPLHPTINSNGQEYRCVWKPLEESLLVGHLFSRERPTLGTSRVEEKKGKIGRKHKILDSDFSCAISAVVPGVYNMYDDEGRNSQHLTTSTTQ